MSRDLSDISYVNLEFSSTSISDSWIMFDDFIYVIDSTETIGTATTDGSGNFSVTPSSGLAEGYYSLIITATDSAGNTSKSSTLDITIDKKDLPLIEWTKVLGTNSGDWAKDIEISKDGFIYIVGSSEGNLENQVNSGGWDAFITKLNSQGATEWTNLIGTSSWDHAFSLDIDTEGSIYVGGYSPEDLDNQQNAGENDAFITKFNPDGEKDWTILFGSEYHEEVHAIEIDSDGSIYIAGSTRGNLGNETNNGNWDCYVSKFNSDGNILWTTLLGTNEEDWIRDMTIGNDGYIYLGGATKGDLEDQNNQGSYDGFLSKLDYEGSKIWTRLIGTSSDDSIQGITYGDQDFIYVSGQTYGSLDDQINAGSEDAFISKFDSDGNKIWTTLFGGSSDADYPHNIVAGSNDSLFVTGYTKSDFSNQINNGQEDIFIAEFNTEGNQQWIELIGTPTLDVGHSLTVDENGFLYITGGTKGNLNGLENNGNEDIFITKIRLYPVIRGNSLYTIVDGPSWTEAEANANKLGGNLVTINDEKENDFILNTFSGEEYFNNEKYYNFINVWNGYYSWIGLFYDFDVNEWLNSSGEIQNYFNWRDPNKVSYLPFLNEKQYGNTVTAINFSNDYPYIEDGEWEKSNDKVGAKRDGIAETKFIRRGDSAYVIVEGPTWAQAEANANKLGGHLVTINDAEENQWLVDNLAGYSYYYEEGDNWTPETQDGKDYFKDQYWIGFTRNGTNFSWADGTSWNYSNFGSGEPALNGDYGEITLAPKNTDWSKIAGKWNDENKDHPHYGIAEIKLAPNNAPTGQPAINGTVQVGQTLTADISSVSDADNFQGWTPTYAYSWKSSSDNSTWNEIGTASTYELTESNKGKYIKVDVSYMDGYGTYETVSSLSKVIPNNIIRGNSLYTLITDPSSNNGPGWDQAESDSNKIGGNLLTINNSEENDWIHETFNITSNPNSSFPSYYWTGFNDVQVEGDWIWSSGESATYTNWWGNDWPSIDPPPYPNPNENYMELGWVSNNRWNDRPSTDLNNIIGGISETKFIRRGDSAYVIVEGPTWEEAEANANKLGGHLVTINDAEESEWINSTFIDLASQKAISNEQIAKGSIFIGLNDNKVEGIYEWSSGEISTYRNWSDGQPQNYYLDEDYVGIFFNWADIGKWHDIVGDQRFLDYGYGIAEIKLAPNNAPTGILSITGEAIVGETLIFDSSNINDLDNFEGYTPTYNYSWEVSKDDGQSWSVLTSADATDNNKQLTLTEEETRLQIRGFVSYLDGYGTNEKITSAANTVSSNLIIRGNHLYTIGEQDSWGNAQIEAGELGGNLVTINNQQEDQWLDSNYSESLWIGLSAPNPTGYTSEPTDSTSSTDSTDSSSGSSNDGASVNPAPGLEFSWVDGSNSSYRGAKWNERTLISQGSSTPESNDVNWYFHTKGLSTFDADADGGQWSASIGGDHWSSTQHKGLIETPFIRRGDSAYVVVEGPTWEEAEANANKLGGHLVTINDADENQWLVDNNLVGWIGFTDKVNEGEWLWISGEIGNYTNWGNNDPDNIGNEDYANNGGHLGTWGDSNNIGTGNGGPHLKGVAEIKLAPNNAPSGSPTISGSLEIGETLTADISSINDADNFQGWTPTYSYSWKSSSDKNNWTEIGTDSTYVITSAEEGKYLKLDVSYLDGYGTVENLSSSISALINYVDDGDASFSITGTATIGNILSITEDTPDPDGTGTLSYSWQSSSDGSTGWSEISTSSTYTLTSSEEGKYIQAVISYTDDEGFLETVTTSSVEIPIELVIRGNSLYTIVEGPGWTWNEAQSASLKIGGNLTTINSAEENQWLVDTFGFQNSTIIDDFLVTDPSETFAGHWIGYTDQEIEGQWKWISGESSTYHNWGSPYGIYGPDNNYAHIGGQDYAIISYQGGSKSGLWDDLTNTDRAYRGLSETLFIRRGDSAYVIVEGPTWEEAEANANKLGGHLVTINNPEENQWLVDNLSGRDDYYNVNYYDEYWIGLDQDNNGDWFWSSGDELIYENWYPGFPNDPSNLYGQLHGEINLSATNQGWRSIAGSWNDEFYNSNAGGHYGIAEIQLAPNNAPTGLPTISGSLVIGETLTADISSINDVDNFQGWTPTYSYSWKSSTDKNTWTEIGTDSTYVITSAEEGKYLKLDVSYLDGYGTVENLSSSISDLINYVDNGDASFSITGTATVGNTLSITEDTPDPDGTGTLSYSWQSSTDNNTWSVKTTDSSYLIGYDDIGKNLKAVISYTDGEGFTESITTASIIISSDPVFKGTSGDDNLNGGTLADTFFGYEGNDNIKGFAGNDTAYGGSGNDNIYGYSDEDPLPANSGNDNLKGGSGNDTIMGHAGNDNISGGSGDDSLYGGTGNDSLTGGSGDDFLYGEAGDDNLTGGSGIDEITGESGDDILYGNSGNDILRGGDDMDTLYGGSGNDELFGDAGADALFGNSGNDVLFGGLGDDELVGGSGVDVFKIDGGAGRDWIRDFSSGEDKIELISGSFGVSMSQSGNQTMIYQEDDLMAILDNVLSDDLTIGSTLIS